MNKASFSHILQTALPEVNTRSSTAAGDFSPSSPPCTLVTQPPSGRRWLERVSQAQGGPGTLAQGPLPRVAAPPGPHRHLWPSGTGKLAPLPVTGITRRGGGPGRKPLLLLGQLQRPIFSPWSGPKSKFPIQQVGP